MIAGCVADPDSRKPAKMTFKVEKGVGKLGSDIILKNCQAYQIKELTYEGFFKDSGLYVLYDLIGPRKSDLEKVASSGYAILGDWTVSKKMQDARNNCIKLQREHPADKKDKKAQESQKMMLDYLTMPGQRVLMLKSADPTNDFSLVFGLIPIQNKDFKFAPKDVDKMKTNKKLASLEFAMN